MNILFSIEYRTSWGEDVRVAIAPAGRSGECLVPLSTADGVRWMGNALLRAHSFTYYYVIYRGDVEVRREYAGVRRRFDMEVNADKLLVFHDSWKDLPDDLPAYSSAFAHIYRPRQDEPCVSFPHALCVKAYFPCPPQGYELAMVGSDPALGGWNPAKAIKMSGRNFPEWEARVDIDSLKFPLEFKFVLVGDGEVVWENNPNRHVDAAFVEKGDVVVLSDCYATFDLPQTRWSGVVIPIFSLRSRRSNGIGDFCDLIPFADWARAVGMRFVQVLPVNDTTVTKTWADSYPYNAISIYALNPLYINLQRAGALRDKEAAAAFEARGEVLNGMRSVDYEAVLKLKGEYLRLLYEQNWGRTKESGAYIEFYKRNEAWLKPYAAFSYLRDIYKTSDFRSWHKFARYDQADVDAMTDESGEDFKYIAYYYFVQFLAHVQLSEAVAYARAQGVMLKGDIPIGINRDSVEAWSESAYFNMDGQAGAPPDAFSAKGQNWGFPTYNWQVMEADGFRWWKKRFEKMAEYFDAYRIDHVLGFFRIWEIPYASIDGMLGHFSPALPLSVEEIKAAGIDFCADLHASPYITEQVLASVFGEKTELVKKQFLSRKGDGALYKLHAEVDTQRKIMANAAVSGMPADIREGLLKLVGNVLFVKDPIAPDHYHPRIGVQNEIVYALLLDEGEKRAFDALSDDFFYHRHNAFWEREALKKLPALVGATQMLACAEDLGMIPACVPDVMSKLRILSLEVQRMPKKFGEEFGVPAEYPYYSVCTTSTHDTSTLRGWWMENSAQTARYYNHILGCWGEPPRHATPELCHLVVKKHLDSPSMLCILPLQDWLSMSGELRNPDIQGERINDPSNPRHYWRYRMHLFVEDLLEAEDFNKMLSGMIKEAGRMA